MKTKTIKLYDYDELSPKARERALADWKSEGIDTYDLQVHLDTEIEGLLEKHGIKAVSDVKGYPTTHAKIYFSLASCQGDGLCFENTFTWGKYTVYIKHNGGRYYHSNSAHIELQESDNLGFHMDDEDADVKRFDAIYQEICKELEREGYAYIEDLESEARFIEDCNANEWTFRENGKMENITD